MASNEGSAWLLVLAHFARRPGTDHPSEVLIELGSRQKRHVVCGRASAETGSIGKCDVLLQGASRGLRVRHVYIEVSIYRSIHIFV